MKFNISCNSLLPLTKIIQENLERLDIDYLRNEQGYFEISPSLSKEHRASLENAWKKYGVRLIEDERECLVQRIKDLLFKIVNSGKPMRTTMSCYLSEHFGLTYGYLTSIFSAVTHCSIEQYTILLKIEKGKRMIIEEELSLKEISDSLCYSSLGHFSKQFKKVTGITLSDFRKIINRRRYGIN